MEMERIPHADPFKIIEEGMNELKQHVINGEKEQFRKKAADLYFILNKMPQDVFEEGKLAIFVKQRILEEMEGASPEERERELTRRLGLLRDLRNKKTALLNIDSHLAGLRRAIEEAMLEGEAKKEVVSHLMEMEKRADDLKRKIIEEIERIKGEIL